eukprot:12931955-Prorocentrum_lima.AAC.1
MHTHIPWMRTPKNASQTEDAVAISTLPQTGVSEEGGWRTARLKVYPPELSMLLAKNLSQAAASTVTQ